MRIARLGVLATAVCVAVLTAAVPAALAVTLRAGDRSAVSASSFHLPYTDPNQAGWLTLCGTNLRPLTGGSITTAPFVWRVVSSAAAPNGYFIKGAKATMFAYQPRPYTPAGAWSGTVMGAASYYSNHAHPMAQFTPIDSALTQMTLAFPPIWDHLIELRLYLSAPNTPALTTRYAAADIQVIGKTWRLVAGGQSSCTAGQAVSEEVVVGMPGAKGMPKHPQIGSSGHAGSGSTGADGGPTALSHSSSVGAGVLGGVIGALAVAGLLVGGLWWRRRRTAS